ncbi:uncharacterized protein LOC125208968 [Salvia hispanica]|uniref:uncharacterized protein LOC125208968 n=1 Tax=Salvia hispanica TaxID=49212 RepID=UPI002009654C|nr:uncharacterized protein LOC125208968 [Salvia hispanica]
MSLEERKIREELEREVENDLEREIKEGIHDLAMKLHNLHLHRSHKQSSNQQNKKLTKKTRKGLVTEVNIKIKMEGGITIEIKESKKEDCGINPNYCTNPKQIPRRVKFDWTQSLRSGSQKYSHESKIEGKTAMLELGWKY